MYRGFILLLGIFLGSHAPVLAQTPAPQIVPAQERVAPTMAILRTVSTPLPTASLLLSQDPGRSPAHFSRLFAGVYERDHSLERLPHVEEVKSLFFKQSSLPLVQLWSRRLQLDAFQNTLNIQNPRSVHLSGLSLNFHFGRDAQTGRPTQAWGFLSRIVSTVLN